LAVPSVLEAFRCELAATHMSCPDSFRGFLHSGEPRGRDETVAGVPCYVSSPPGGSTATAPIILFLSDVFGHTFGEPRARLLRLPDFQPRCQPLGFLFGAGLAPNLFLRFPRSALPGLDFLPLFPLPILNTPKK
jgi:hypothetical protein